MSNQNKDNVMVVNVLTAELSVEINPDTRLPELRGFDQMRELFYLELENRDKALQAERQRCEGLMKQVEDIKTQAGYEIEQSRHHLEVAEKMGMEKRFSFVASVSGFERLKGQLESALSPTSAVESEKCEHWVIGGWREEGEPFMDLEFYRICPFCPKPQEPSLLDRLGNALRFALQFRQPSLIGSMYARQYEEAQKALAEDGQRNLSHDLSFPSPSSRMITVVRLKDLCFIGLGNRCLS